MSENSTDVKNNWSRDPDGGLIPRQNDRLIADRKDFDLASLDLVEVQFTSDQFERRFLLDWRSAIQCAVSVRDKVVVMKNGVFWDVTPCGSCKNRRFGGTWRLLHQSDKNR
jgi:hypothetical protein